ncbi:OmpA family protein [Photobacterium nomapromontoriensis]|uniref:OmpA family protein n=1 Tax=Photobacterium nomapromontoriensis TaxID=2910237 RepID=UPI003D0E5AEA
MRPRDLTIFYHLFYCAIMSVMLSACGNGSDDVTKDPFKTSPPQTQPVVPHAKTLLITLPEMGTSVYFGESSVELTVEDQLLIDPIAVRLRKHPDSHVIVIGYGNDYTNEDDNLAISYERALSTAIYIASVFTIEEERIQIVAAGSIQSPKQRPQVMQQGRRVDIIAPKVIVRTLTPHTHKKY